MRLSEPEFIAVGEILGHWGARGELKVEVLTEFPERFAPSSQIYLDRKPMTIHSCAWHKGKAIIKLSTVDTAEDARKLRGRLIEIHRSQVNPLPEGEYYHFQIIGMQMWTTGGELLGNIARILTSASNDIYIVRNDKGEILIPAIEDVVKSVDLKQGRMVIEPMDGLLN